jgi:hypothetical protein
MRTLVGTAAMSLCVVSLAQVMSADTLVFRDGSRVEGTVLAIVGRTITFRHADGVSRRYPTSQVDSLEFFSADRENRRAVNARRLEAPAGTELVVRTVETIDSRRVGADQLFAAIVEHEISDTSGHVIIPARSSAQLVIREVRSGNGTGTPEMVLDIQSITVDGRRYALGMVAGAIENGRKTRATGLLIGAADSAVTAQGSHVEVPAETVLRFLLDKPVTLRGWTAFASLAAPGTE